MKPVSLVTSALRRVSSQGLLVAALAVASVSNVQAAITTTQTGTNNGYYYSFWRANSTGTVSMNLGSGGNYSVSFNNCPNFTCGKGWNPGSARTIGYNVGSYSNSGGGSLGVYGWTTNPLVEYYVNEMWGSTRPTGTYVARIVSDGAYYDIYKHQQVSQPSIQGTATFWQYISTRDNKNSTKSNHTVTTANHFNAWKSKIGSMGTFNYQILLTESWGGANGYSNVTVW